MTQGFTAWRISVKFVLLKVNINVMSYNNSQPSGNAFGSTRVIKKPRGKMNSHTGAILVQEASRVRTSL